jgi:hypothetical protein
MGQTGRNALMPTITYNIPAGQAADVLEALRAHYGVPGATPAELNTIIGNELKAAIRDRYRDYMKKKSYDVVLD